MNPEPVYVRECETCTKPRIATANRLQMKEGEGEWTDVSLVSIRCSCGTSTPNELDLISLREKPLETAVEGFVNNRKLIDRLKGVAHNRCSGLHRAGHPNPFGSVLKRVRALNKAAGRQDELMEQFIAEACLQAEQAWKDTTQQQ